MASPTAKRSLTLSDGSRIVDALVPSLRTELTNRSLSSEGLRTALESRLLEVRAQELLLLLATGETIASLSADQLDASITARSATPAGSVENRRAALTELRRGDLFDPAVAPPLGGVPAPGAPGVDLAFDPAHVTDGLVSVSNPVVLVPSTNPLYGVLGRLPGFWVDCLLPTAGGSGRMFLAIVQLLLLCGCTADATVSLVTIGSIATLACLNRMVQLLARDSTVFEFNVASRFSAPETLSRFYRGVSGLAADARKLKLADFQVPPIIAPADSVPLARYATLSICEPWRFFVLNSCCEVPFTAPARMAATGSEGLLMMNSEFFDVGGLSPPSLSHMAQPSSFKFRNALRNFLDAGAMPEHCRSSVAPFDMASYLVYKERVHNFGDESSSSALRFLRSFLAQPDFAVLAVILDGLPSTTCPGFLLGRLIAVLLPSQVGKALIEPVLRALQSAVVPFAYAYAQVLPDVIDVDGSLPPSGGPGPVASGSLPERRVAAIEAALVRDRGMSSASSSASSLDEGVATGGGTAASVLNKVLSSVSPVLANISSAPATQEGNLEVVKLALRSRCNAVFSALDKAPSAALAASFPALAKVFAARQGLCDVVAAEVFKNAPAASSGSVTSFRDTLSLHELLAVAKGTLLSLPRLALLYSAYRRFTVLNRDFSDRTIAEILGDGQMLRSFMVFLKSLYATFGFDVAQLDAVVTACDDFALRVDDQQRLVAFVFNAQQAFCQSFLDYTSALHAWYSVVSLDSPPKLVAALQHLVDANEALNKISGMDLSAFGLHSAAGAVAASSVFCPPVVATELALKRPRSPEPTSSDPSGAHKRDSDFC